LNSGVIRYQPGLSTYSGSCQLLVTITDNDNHPLTSQVPVTIIITARVSPVAVDDTITVDQNAGSITINTSWLLSNDIAPISTGIGFLGLVPCTSGYCRQTPTYHADTNSITIPVDPLNCIMDRFQYTIQTTDAYAAKSTATVNISFKNCYCRTAMDLYFVLDNSVSIGAQQWELVKAFATNVTNKMSISESNVKIGIMDFGNYGNSVLSLTSNTTLIYNTINNMMYRGENTATKSGLYAVVQDVTGVYPNNQSKVGADGTPLVPKGRIGVPKVLLVLTDGYPNIPFAGSKQNDSLSYVDNCQSLYNDNSLNPVNCSQGVFAEMSGIPPSMCSLSNHSGLPCSDPTGYTNQINSWTSASSSAFGSQFPSWRVVTIGVGDVVSTPFGMDMLSAMNQVHDAMFVGWSELSSISSSSTDTICNSQ